MLQRPGLARVGAAIAGAVLASSCAFDDTVAYLVEACESASDCGGGACVDGACTGSPPASCSETPSPRELCSAASPPIVAFCARDGVVSAFPLVVDGKGSLGTNGPMNAAGGLAVDGSVVVAGVDGVVLPGPGDVHVGGSLAVGGPLVGGVSVSVGGDATIARNVDLRDFTVGGTLLTTPGAIVSVTGERRIGREETGPVDVDPPCVDREVFAEAVSALVRAARSDNDDGRAGLDPFRLDGFDGPLTLPLSCGSYHFSGISGRGALALDISGDVRLFVDGELSLDDSLTVTLAPGATLTVYVDGDVRLASGATLGAPETPGKVNVYGAGSGTLALAGDTRLSGSLLAPRAELVNQGALTLFGGALWTRRAAPNADVTVHYDAALEGGLAGCR